MPELHSLRRKAQCAMITSNALRGAGTGIDPRMKMAGGCIGRAGMDAWHASKRSMQHVPLASVGVHNRDVNYNPLSYIRHITQ